MKGQLIIGKITVTQLPSILVNVLFICLSTLLLLPHCSPKSFTIDPVKLQATFRSLQAQLHPDKFAKQPAVSDTNVLCWYTIVRACVRMWVHGCMCAWLCVYLHV